jgi:hypothetical protein
MGGIFQLSCFGIGTDKPDEIDVILEHCFYLLFARPVLPGTREARGRSPAEDDSFLEGDPNWFWERSPKPKAAHRNFRTRAPGAGITRSECPAEPRNKGD